MRELDVAHELAAGYLAGVAERPVGGGDAPGLRRPLTDGGEDAETVLRELAADIEPGLTASAGPRYFGFVIGGALPVAVGADWLVSAWDQMSFSRASSPAIAALEEVAAAWVLDVLGLPATAGLGFVTGAQMANVTCLAAARDALRERHGARDIDVVVGEEVHATVPLALRLIGLGEDRVTRVAVDANGAMDPGALAGVLAAGDGPAIVCAQAGNVNTGACDPLGAIADAAAVRGAWLHVDGAFGLWAAASPRRAELVAGRERADSWALDAHKWLNVPYDCAFAIVADAQAHARATALVAPYLAVSAGREPSDYTPEASRRARAVPVYAALRTLGRDGIAALVDRCCDHAALMAQLLAAGGMEILNDVVLNQVLAATTPDHVARIQADGTCWLGGTVWRGRDALRVAVSNWSTTEDDIRRSAEAILATR